MAIIIPKITGSLSTKTVGQQTPADFTKVEKSIQGLGDQVARVSEVFRQGIITEQVSKQTISVNQQLNELADKQLQDPNITESSGNEYRAKADQILSKSMDQIGDPVATRQFQVGAQASILAGENNIRKAGRAAQKDRFDVDTATIRGQSLTASFQTNDPVQQMIARQVFVDQLNRGVNNLYKSRLERQTAIAKYDEDKRTGKAQYDMDLLTAPGNGVTFGDRANGAQVFIDQVRGGAYPELTTQEQTEFVNRAKAFMDVNTKRDRVEIEARQFTKWQEILPKIKAGTITEAELRLLNLDIGASPDSGEISNAQFDKAKAMADSKKGVAVKTDNSVFHAIEKKIYGQETKPDGTFYTPNEISDIIDASYESVDEEDIQQLIADNTAERISQTKHEIAASAKGLEARITSQVLRSDDILYGTKDPVTGKIIKAGVVQGDVTVAKAAQAIADEYMSRFDREVHKKKLQGEDITKLEQKIELQFLRENDLFVGAGATAHVSVGVSGEVKRHFADKTETGATAQFKLVPVEIPLDKKESQ